METHVSSADDAVLLYGNDRRTLTQQVTRYIAEGLAADEAVVVIATAANASLFESTLKRRGSDVQRATREGRFVLFDADEIQKDFIVDGRLNSLAFISFMQ